MAKCYSIIVIIGMAFAWVSAEPPLFRQSKRLGNLGTQNNRKLFARQEQTPYTAPSPAPYPPAGVTPEIPFDLPTKSEAPLTDPDQTYGPPELNPGETYLPPEQTPDQTYGPPELNPNQTYGTPKAEDTPSITEPDNTYIPPTADEQHATEEPANEELPPSESNLLSQNLVQPRKRFRARSRSSQLRLRGPSQRSRLAAFQFRTAPVQPRFNTVEIINSEPVLIYTLH